jgi:hypothetical protein
MNIHKSELFACQKLFSPLTRHNALPVLDYVRFGGGKIVKSVLSAFVELKCKEADTEMLVDEKLLNVKIGNAQSDFLNFSKKSNKVTITDSVTPTSFQVPDVKEFPALPEPTSEKYSISANFMKVLEKAQYFPLKLDVIPDWKSFIMIGNGHVCASDGHAFFMEPIDEEFEIVLDKRSAQIICKLPIKEYAFSDSYMFFYTENATIGFSKQEIKYINIIKYGQINGSPMEFVASANDFQKFNEECIQSTKFPFVTVTDGKISLHDIDLDISLERVLESVKPSSYFNYNAETMNRILTVVEGDEIQFFKGERWYWIKCPDQKSTMLLMQLAS